VNFKKYVYRGTIFGSAGLVAVALELGILYLLTQLGIWYMWSAIIGHIIGGLILYNLNVVSGNIKLAGRRPVIGLVCQHAGCTSLADIECECGMLLCVEHHTNHR
jgi:hypothetical protein